MTRRRGPQGGKVLDPAFRQRRASKAGRVSARTRRRRALAAAARFPDKAIAYAAGYRSGYQVAARWWSHRYHRLLARVASLERAA